MKLKKNLFFKIPVAGYLSGFKVPDLSVFLIILPEDEQYQYLYSYLHHSKKYSLKMKSFNRNVIQNRFRKPW